MTHDLDHVTVSRRTLLLAGGAAGLAACTSDSSETTPTPDTSRPVATATPATGSTGGVVGLAAADFDALDTCILTRASTAGPFPLDEQFDRRDITEGYPGHPLRLGLRVVDGSCSPVPDATVEIWHTDATGDYSAFTDGGNGKDEGPGTTFLRGSQTADSDGIVEFQSLYPGWYPGRCVHIHLRVHIGDATVLTSQLFFDDAYTASVFATGEYEPNGLPDTTNAQDFIAGDPAADGTLLFLRAADTVAGPGTLGLSNLGVDPSTRRTSSSTA